jgi:fatty-acyl-CoA synthase
MLHGNARETGSAGRAAGWLDGQGPGTGIVRGVIEGPADIAAIEQVEPGAVLAGSTIYDCLKYAAEHFADKPAIVAMRTGNPLDAVRTLTYREYLHDVRRAANLFAHASAGDPPVVAMMLPVIPEALITAWGATTVGRLNPVNPHLEPAMVAAILSSVGATVLVTTRAHGASAADRLDEITAQVPSLRRVLLVDAAVGEDDFAAALQTMPGDRLDVAGVRDPDAICTYLPTGGTTALPKLARLTHRGMALNAWIGGAIMGAADDEVIGIGMPLFHVGGLIMLALRSAILGQTALLLTPSGFRDPGVVEHFWEHARRHSMTSLIATPTTAAALLNGKGDSTGHSIRTFTCGGSTVPVDLGRRFPEAFGVHLREVWGATEFHGFLGCQPNGIEPLIGSVGLRTPWHDVKAVLLDDDNRYLGEASPGEQGVIVGRGPCVCEGYLDPSLDSGFLVDAMPDGARWGSSGDLGRVDDQGYIWIDGRAKDVIIRGGHNIDPKPIEEALCRHPAVLHAAAVGLPDASKGELPIAYVQFVAGQDVAESDLLDYCRAHLPERAGQPVSVFAIDAMPLTPVGKIFKPALRKDAMRRVVDTVVRQHCGDGASWSVDLPDTKGRPTAVVHLDGAQAAQVDAVQSALRPFQFEAHVKCDPANLRHAAG